MSIRFGRDRRMYVADYKGHNVFLLSWWESGGPISIPINSTSRNDMALARDGALYASDPHWRRREGQVWRIVPDGETGRGDVMASERKFTTTNGIDLSRTRARSTSPSRRRAEIWAYRVDGDRLAAPPGQKVLRFQPWMHPHRRRRPHLCGAILKARSWCWRRTAANCARSGSPPRSRPIWRSAERTGEPSMSRSAGRLHRDVPCRPAGAGVLPAARRRRSGVQVAPIRNPHGCPAT